MIKTNVLKMKKTFAVFLAMLMMTLSLSFTSNISSEADNTSRRYIVYDSKDGSSKRSYTLDAVPTSNDSRMTKPDDRVIDWTKSGVVKIMNDEGYIGSGFVVDKHLIATAGHCVYNENKKIGEVISEILLFDTDGNITMHATPVESHVTLEYVRSKEENFNDYALISVKEDLSDYMCFDLGVPLDSFADGETNATVSVTGFPKYLGSYEEVNTHTQHKMYTGKGKVNKATEEEWLFYGVYTSGCNSGGPVYITESEYGKTYYTVVAIHTGMSPDINSNRGQRITTDLINFYKSNDHILW